MHSVMSEQELTNGLITTQEQLPHTIQQEVLELVTKNVGVYIKGTQHTNRKEGSQMQSSAIKKMTNYMLNKPAHAIAVLQEIEEQLRDEYTYDQMFEDIYDALPLRLAERNRNLTERELGQLVEQGYLGNFVAEALLAHYILLADTPDLYVNTIYTTLEHAVQTENIDFIVYAFRYLINDIEPLKNQTTPMIHYLKALYKYEDTTNNIEITPTCQKCIDLNTVMGLFANHKRLKEACQLYNEQLTTIPIEDYGEGGINLAWGLL